jgi:hypothetical protein
MQMGIALGFTGWWMYIDVPATPNAVVVCVIVFNAAFGYRYVTCHSLQEDTRMLSPLELGTHSMALST